MSKNVTQTKPLTYEQWSHILGNHYSGNLIIAETDLLFKRIRDAKAPVNDVPECVKLAFRQYYVSECQKRRPAPITRECWQAELREVNRTKILNAVVPGKTTAKEIQKAVDLSRSNVCLKLFELECMGIITHVKRGIEFVYSLVPVQAKAVAG